MLEPYQGAGRLCAFKKPKSQLKGDLFPQLATQFADLLAIPLTEIYNCITRTAEWPTSWKIEYVTVIPKVPKPESFGQLRNISCTVLASKLYESYLMDWSKDEISTRGNQFGGVKGCGTSHYLIETWQVL